MFRSFRTSGSGLLRCPGISRLAPLSVQLARPEAPALLALFSLQIPRRSETPCCQTHEGVRRVWPIRRPSSTLPVNLDGPMPYGVESRWWLPLLFLVWRSGHGQPEAPGRALRWRSSLPECSAKPEDGGPLKPPVHTPERTSVHGEASLVPSTPRARELKDKLIRTTAFDHPGLHSTVRTFHVHVEPRMRIDHSHITSVPRSWSGLFPSNSAANA